MTNEELLALIDARSAADAAFAALVAERADVAIAEALSKGRTKLVPTEVGVGTILATLGDGGGAFLDTLVDIGTVNRNVHWTMVLINDGRLRIDLPATRSAMSALAAAVPALSQAIAALLTLGYAPDPVSWTQVAAALGSR